MCSRRYKKARAQGVSKSWLQCRSRGAISRDHYATMPRPIPYITPEESTSSRIKINPDALFALSSSLAQDAWESDVWVSLRVPLLLLTATVGIALHCLAYYRTATRHRSPRSSRRHRSCAYPRLRRNAAALQRDTSSAVPEGEHPPC